jgi:glycosyltransferase involved in cell wall biosynthesis
MIENVPVRIALQQRVLPSYRIPFFDALAKACPQGLSVYAGDPRPEEALSNGAVPMEAQFFHARNIHLFSGLFYACWQTDILKWLEGWQPQVLIMEANPRYPRSYTAINWMRKRGGKVIGWGLGSPEPHGPFADVRLRRRKNFIGKFDALITYSQSGSEEYARLGFPADMIFTAPNAVAPKPTHPLPERPKEFRAGKASVLFVGRLQARKKVDQLIRACAQLPAQQQPQLSIVGDGPLRRELESLANEVYPMTKFHGAQHGSELDNLLQNADLFVLPGTGGLAVQQAMSFGLPVIVGAADGTQSNLVQPENGWMLAESSVECLSSTIKAALGNISRLRKMGAASYQIVNREVNLENMVTVFIKTINKILEV